MKRHIFLHSLQAPGAAFYQTMPRFAELLREVGLELVLFTPVDDAEIYGVRNVRARWDLWSERPVDFAGEIVGLKGEESRMMEAMIEFAGIEADVGAIGRTRKFWEEQLASLKPVAVLVCEVDNAHSLILTALCRGLKLPCWHLAKGVLDKTWQLDPWGHIRSGSMVMAMDVAMGAEGHRYRYSYEEVRDYFLNAGHSYYPHANAAPDGGLAGLSGDGGRKVILVFGGGWMSATQLPHELGVLSPVFRYTSQMMEWLVANWAEVAPGAKLVFKNHPGDKTDYSWLADAGVEWQPGVAFNSLIEAADVVVSLTTILQFECLLREVPQVVLTNSELSGKGIVYEALSSEEIGARLREALVREDFEAMRERGRRFMERVANLFLIGVENGMPCGFDLRDAAQFLSRFRSHVPEAIPEMKLESEVEPRTLAFLEAIYERKRLQQELEAAKVKIREAEEQGARRVKEEQKAKVAVEKELRKQLKIRELMEKKVQQWNARSWLKRAFNKLTLTESREQDD